MFTHGTHLISLHWIRSSYIIQRARSSVSDNWFEICFEINGPRIPSVTKHWPLGDARRCPMMPSACGPLHLFSPVFLHSTNWGSKVDYKQRQIARESVYYTSSTMCDPRAVLIREMLVQKKVTITLCSITPLLSPPKHRVGVSVNAVHDLTDPAIVVYVALRCTRSCYRIRQVWMEVKEVSLPHWLNLHIILRTSNAPAKHLWHTHTAAYMLTGK